MKRTLTESNNALINIHNAGIFLTAQMVSMESSNSKKMKKHSITLDRIINDIVDLEMDMLQDLNSVTNENIENCFFIINDECKKFYKIEED